mmetsp:Transcript_25190/g.58569  ORF Transcript_25190/g.58569 Transcript_25190/m.58569 type:complete len:80 (+) Transcript_25190:416-655(+)
MRCGCVRAKENEGNEKMNNLGATSRLLLPEVQRGWQKSLETQLTLLISRDSKLLEKGEVPGRCLLVRVRNPNYCNKLNR